MKKKVVMKQMKVELQDMEANAILNRLEKSIILLMILRMIQIYLEVWKGMKKQKIMT